MDIRFVTAHSGRTFPIYIVGISYRIPIKESNIETVSIATVIVTEDDFIIGKANDKNTIPQIAYTKLCKATGYAKGGLIVEKYIIEQKITQTFIV